MNRYRITYDYDGGKGRVELNVPESEMQEVVGKLRNLGCYNITIAELIKPDPCDHCNKQLCYGCPHAED